MSHQTSSVPQNPFHLPPMLTQPMTEFPKLDSGLAIPVFNQGDNPIAFLNKAMAFMSTVDASHFPSTNNQLRISSNLRNHATIQDGGQAKVVKCYNFQGEGHMARQYNQPKSPRNTTWFKKKAMLAEAKESGHILDEEQLAFLADPRITDCYDVQSTIIHNAAFQTNDLDAYDSDCNDVSFAKAFLMANLSNYSSDVLSELQEKDTTINKLRNHIKSLRESNKKNKVKQDMDEIETINIELEHSVAKLLFENKLLHKEIEHLKKIFKDQFGSIKKTCAYSKEHCDSLIAQLNSKFMENADLKCQIQEKVFVTTTLQNELRRLKVPMANLSSCDPEVLSKVKEKQENDKNRIKTGQKREACRSWEKFKAVAVERGRKTEENKKRMAENAYTYQKLCKFKEKKKREGPFLYLQESSNTRA
nr:hypothetical protein [Tanacetum cinerariifolium]